MRLFLNKAIKSANRLREQLQKRLDLEEEKRAEADQVFVHKVKTSSSALRGEARHVQLTTQGGPGGSSEVLRFMLDRIDEKGDPLLPPIAIEMRGRISGILSEGHHVRILDSWKPGQTLHPERLFNETTSAVVRRS